MGGFQEATVEQQLHCWGEWSSGGGGWMWAEQRWRWAEQLSSDSRALIEALCLLLFLVPAQASSAAAAAPPVDDLSGCCGM